MIENSEMIGYLNGKLMEIQDGKALVAIANVGYAVSVPSAGKYATLHTGDSVELWVHTHVREDALDLYGFLSKEEKEIFLTLLTVNGIGPKGAMGILSKVEIPTLVRAILEGDQKTLTDIPGIGKKTAERVVVELRDSMRKKAENEALPMGWATAPKGSKVAFSMRAYQDAKDALVGLGYREQDVVQALKRVQGTLPESSAKTEEVVKQALKELH